MNSSPEQRLKREIGAARALFNQFGQSLHREPQLRRMLTVYGEAIHETQGLMHELGVAAACTGCAEEGPGSCCFEGIETGYDRILLLVNLLLGAALPNSRELPGGCFFVGKAGCTLLARYYYCVHYLCPDLQTALKAGAKEALLSAVAKELAAGWEMEQALREWGRRQLLWTQLMGLGNLRGP